MSAPVPPPPLGSSWKQWGESLNTFIVRTRDQPRYKTGGESASEDGILMWDRALNALVVSKNGVWVKVKLDP